MLESDLLHQLVADAICAPSSHNTQPWRFRLAAREIALYADRTRALPVNDPHDRELTISCGAALFNLRVAAAARGHDLQVAIAPDVADPDLLARAIFSQGRSVDSGLAELHTSIGKRRTYRKRFADRHIAPGAIDALAAAVEAEGAMFEVQSGANHRRDLCLFVAEADALLWDYPSWRRELAAWMHPRRQGDGLMVPEYAAPIAQAIVRTFDLGSGVAARDRDIAEQSPILAIVCTQADAVEDWMAAGQALERALLVAVEQGLQASYLNQPLALAKLRSRVKTVLGLSGIAQVILRLGHPAEEIPASPRRPIEDVLD